MTSETRPYPKEEDSGLGGIPARWMAGLVLRDLDYEAQLAAVRSLLRRNQEADKGLEKEIEEITRFAEHSSGLRNEQAVNELIGRYHDSVYQDAAHSMAAVGMLAPLFESLFTAAFHGIHEHFHARSHSDSHCRWNQAESEAWDCHNFWSDSGRRSTNLVEGILQLADACALAQYLPSDFRKTLEALFTYRNKMFHNGFEWPRREREKFDTRMSEWPSEWFAKATSGDAPWVFYMSDTFIEHCIATIGEVLAGLGQYCKHASQSGEANR